MNAISYLYTGLYRMLLKTSDKDIAEYSALFLISGGLSINFIVLLRLISLHPEKFISARVFGGIVFTSVVVVNCFYFISNSHHKNLINNSQEWTTQKKRFNSIVSILFCLESISIPVLYSLIEDGIFKL